MPANVSAVAIPPLLALIAAVLVIAALLRTRVGALIVDHPNHRSLHAVPTPRIGGIGVVCGVLAGAAAAGFVIDPRLTVATALLVSISLVDDIRCIGAGWRMAAHLTAAALAATTFFDTAHNLLPMLATKSFTLGDHSRPIRSGRRSLGLRQCRYRCAIPSTTICRRWRRRCSW